MSFPFYLSLLSLFLLGKQLHASGNAFGQAGGEAFVEALKTNKTLEEIHLGNVIVGCTVRLKSSGEEKVVTDLNGMHIKALGVTDWTNEYDRIPAVLPVKQLRENTITSLDLSSKGLGVDGGLILAALIKDNTSVQQLDASKNAMGTAGAKAVGDLLLVNKTIQTLDVSDNSFGKPVTGDQVKLKSSGEMKTVGSISGGQIYDGSNWINPSEFEWESQVPAFCAGVAASPSLISVSTTFRHASASCSISLLTSVFLPCT